MQCISFTVKRGRLTIRIACRVAKSSSLQEVELGDAQRATDSEVEELSLRMEEEQLLRQGLHHDSAEL